MFTFVSVSNSRLHVSECFKTKAINKNILTHTHIDTPALSHTDTLIITNLKVSEQKEI
jgi:hypothetical protein